jgi:hypothetical protein
MVNLITAELVWNTIPIRLFRRVNLESSYLTKVILFLLSGFPFLGVLAIAYERSNWAAITASVAQFSWPSIPVAFALMLAGGMLASLRLKLIASDIGYVITFRDAVSALSVGQLAGILFFKSSGSSWHAGYCCRGGVYPRRERSSSLAMRDWSRWLSHSSLPWQAQFISLAESPSTWLRAGFPSSRYSWDCSLSGFAAQFFAGEVWLQTISLD